MTREPWQDYLPFQEEEGEMNLTPLIDVVFVVLIVFILLAPLAAPLQIEQIDLAQGNQKLPPLLENNHQAITIYVYADNSIRVNGAIVQLSSLSSYLRKIKTTHQENPQRICLFHDEKAHFGTYQQVKNGVEKAGFTVMDVVLTSH